MYNITGPHIQFSSLSCNAFVLFQVNHPFISYFMLACCSDNWQYTWAFMSKALHTNVMEIISIRFFCFSCCILHKMCFLWHLVQKFLTTESFRSLSLVINPSLAKPPPNHVLKCHICTFSKYPQVGSLFQNLAILKSWEIAKMVSITFNKNGNQRKPCSSLFSFSASLFSFHHYPLWSQEFGVSGEFLGCVTQSLCSQLSAIWILTHLAQPQRAVPSTGLWAWAAAKIQSEFQ